MTRLSEIRARLDAATRDVPAPWQVQVDRDQHGSTGYHVLEHVEPGIALCLTAYWPEESEEPPTDAFGYYQPDNRAEIAPHRIDIARFIAHAPGDLRFLIERVQALEAAMEFYADPASYDAEDVAEGLDALIEPERLPAIDGDLGKRARLALESPDA